MSARSVDAVLWPFIPARSTRLLSPVRGGISSYLLKRFDLFHLSTHVFEQRGASHLPGRFPSQPSLCGDMRFDKVSGKETLLNSRRRLTSRELPLTWSNTSEDHQPDCVFSLHPRTSSPLKQGRGHLRCSFKSVFISDGRYSFFCNWLLWICWLSVVDHFSITFIWK